MIAFLLDRSMQFSTKTVIVLDSVHKFKRVQSFLQNVGFWFQIISAVKTGNVIANRLVVNELLKFSLVSFL